MLLPIDQRGLENIIKKPNEPMFAQADILDDIDVSDAAISPPKPKPSFEEFMQVTPEDILKPTHYNSDEFKRMTREYLRRPVPDASIREREGKHVPYSMFERVIDDPLETTFKTGKSAWDLVNLGVGGAVEGALYPLIPLNEDNWAQWDENKSALGNYSAQYSKSLREEGDFFEPTGRIGPVNAALDFFHTGWEILEGLSHITVEGISMSPIPGIDHAKNREDAAEFFANFVHYHFEEKQLVRDITRLVQGDPYWVSVIMKHRFAKIKPTRGRNVGEFAIDTAQAIGTVDPLSKGVGRLHYSEQQVQTAVKELSKTFDKIKLSDYDRTYQQAISEALFGNYTDPMQMYKEATQRPVGVLLDLFDIAELTKGPQTLGKIGKKTKDLPDKVKKALARWEELRAKNTTKKRALQTKVDQLIADGHLDPTALQRMRGIGEQIADRTKTEFKRAADDIKYLLDPPDDFGGAAPATAGGSLEDLLGIMDETPEPDLTGAENLIPDVDARPSDRSFLQDAGQGRRNIQDVDGETLELMRMEEDPDSDFTRADIDAEMQRRAGTTDVHTQLDESVSEMADEDLISATHNVEIMSNEELLQYRDEIQRRVEEVAAAGMRSTPPANIGQMQAAEDTFNMRIRDLGLEDRAPTDVHSQLDEQVLENRTSQDNFTRRSLQDQDLTQFSHDALSQMRDDAQSLGDLDDVALLDAELQRRGIPIEDFDTIDDDPDAYESALQQPPPRSSESFFDDLIAPADEARDAAATDISTRGTTQTGGMEFLARQDPQGIDFASLTPQQFDELHTIAERDNNQPLLDVMETEASRRLDQENRNVSREITPEDEGEFVHSPRERRNAQGIVDGLRDASRRGNERSPADTMDRLQSELEEAYQRQDMANTRRINSQGRDTAASEEYRLASQEVELLQTELQQIREQTSRAPQTRPDVLQGEGGQQSARGFDTAQGGRAAREGTEAANTFDSNDVYPTPDSIVEKMDAIYTELDSLTPNQTDQKMALERQLAQAQEALRRRIPGRGTRLNMGIDPTQLGEAARGLWKNIANWMDTSETGKRLKGHLRQTHLRSTVSQDPTEMPTRGQDATRILQQNHEILNNYPSVLSRMDLDSDASQERVRNDIGGRIVPILENQRDLRQLYPEERISTEAAVSEDFPDISTEALQDISDVYIEILRNWARKDPSHYAESYKQLQQLINYHNLDKSIFDVPPQRLDMTDADIWKTQTLDIIKKIQDTENSVNLRLRDMQPSRRLEREHPTGHRADTPNIPDPQPLTELTPELIDELSGEDEIYFRITDENDTIYDRLTTDFEQTRLFKNKRIRRVLPGSFRDTTSGKVYREGIYVTDNPQTLADYIEMYPQAQNTRLYIIKGEHLPASVQAPFFNETILKPSEIVAAFDLDGVAGEQIMSQLRSIPVTEQSIAARIERKVKQLRIYAANMNRLRAASGSHISEYGTNEIDTPIADKLDALATEITENVSTLSDEAAAAVNEQLDAAFEKLNELGVDTPLKTIDKIFDDIRENIETARNPWGYTRVPKRPKGPTSAALRSLPKHFAKTESIYEAFKGAIDTWRKTRDDLETSREILGARKNRPELGLIKGVREAIRTVPIAGYTQKKLYDLTAAWGESTVELIRQVLRQADIEPTTKNVKDLYDKISQNVGPTKTGTLLLHIKELQYYVAAENELGRAKGLLTNEHGTTIPFAEETMAAPTVLKLLRELDDANKRLKRRSSGRTDERASTRVTPAAEDFLSKINKHQGIRYRQDRERSVALSLTQITANEAVKNHPVYKVFEEIYEIRQQGRDSRDYNWIFEGVDTYINEYENLLGLTSREGDPRFQIKRPTNSEFEDFSRVVKDTEGFKLYEDTQSQFKSFTSVQDFMTFWHDLYSEFTGTNRSNAVNNPFITELTEALLEDFDNFAHITTGKGNVHKEFRKLNKNLHEINTHIKENFSANLTRALEELASNEATTSATPLVDFIFREDPALIETLWESLFEPQRMRGKSRGTSKQGKMSEQELQKALRTKNVQEWPPEIQLAVVRSYMLKTIFDEKLKALPIDNRRSAKQWAKNPNYLNDWLDQNIGDKKGVIIFGPEIWGALKQMKLGKHIKKRFPGKLASLLGASGLPKPVITMVDNVDEAASNRRAGKQGQLTYMWQRNLASRKHIPDATIMEIMKAAANRLRKTSPYTRQAARKTERAKDTQPLFNVEPTLDFLQMR